MAYWLSQEGYYYELEHRLSDTDISVPRRPSRECNFVNGRWVGAEQESDMGGVHIHRMRLQPDLQQYSCVHNPHQQPCPLPQHDQYRHNDVYEKPQQQQSSNNNSGDVILSEKTKLMFGVRELIMVAAFVITATISWSDTNTRIVKLEDNRAIAELDAKIKTLTTDLQSVDKQHREDFRKLDQTVRDVEQYVLIKNNKSAK